MMSALGISKEWLTRKEASAYLESLGYPIAPRTLASLATRREGPPYRRFLHRIVRYRRAALKTWAEASTTEGGEDILPRGMGALQLSQRE